MLKIIAKMFIKPENAEIFQSTAKELVVKSRAEKGNVFYSLNQSTDNADEFVFIECWENQAAVEAHNAAEHFKKILPKLAELCESSEPVQIFKEILY